MTNPNYQGPSLPFEKNNLPAAQVPPSSSKGKKPLGKTIQKIIHSIEELLHDPFGRDKSVAEEEQLLNKIQKAWGRFNKRVEKLCNEPFRQADLAKNRAQLLNPPYTTPHQSSLKKPTGEEPMRPLGIATLSRQVVQDLLKPFITEAEIPKLDNTAYEKLWEKLSPSIKSIKPIVDPSHPEIENTLPLSKEVFDKQLAPALATLTLSVLDNPTVDIIYLNRIGQKLQEYITTQRLLPAHANILHRLNAHISILISILYPYHELILQKKAEKLPEMEKDFLVEHHTWLQVAAQQLEGILEKSNKDPSTPPDTTEMEDIKTLVALYTSHQEYHKAISILQYLRQQITIEKDAEEHAQLTIDLLEAYTHISPEERTQEECTAIYAISNEVRDYSLHPQDSLRLKGLLARLGQYYAQQREYEQAIVLLEPLHQHHSTTPTLENTSATLELVHCYIHKKHFEEAKTILDELENFFSKDAENFFNNTQQRVQFQELKNYYESTHFFLITELETYHLGRSYNPTIQGELGGLRDLYTQAEAQLTQHPQYQLALATTEINHYCQQLLDNLKRQQGNTHTTLTNGQEKQLEEVSHYLEAHWTTLPISQQRLEDHKAVEAFLIQLYNNAHIPLPTIHTIKETLPKVHLLHEAYTTLDTRKQLSPTEAATKNFIKDHPQAFPSLYVFYTKQEDYVRKMDIILNLYFPLLSDDFIRKQQSSKVFQAYKLLGELYLQQGNTKKAQQIQQLLKHYINSPRPVGQESQK